jgi:hypothetical protein
MHLSPKEKQSWSRWFTSIAGLPQKAPLPGRPAGRRTPPPPALRACFATPYILLLGLSLETRTPAYLTPQRWCLALWSSLRP